MGGVRGRRASLRRALASPGRSAARSAPDRAELSPRALIAALLVAEEVDDIDRTDFSDPALQEDAEEGPSQHVESVSLLPEAADDSAWRRRARPARLTTRPSGRAAC